MDDPQMITPQRSQDLFAEVKKIKGATKAHQAIWQRLLTAQWYEALELARANSLTGAKTARGLTHILCEIYRGRRNSKTRLTQLSSYIEDMSAEAENGLNIRELFAELAEQWGLTPQPDDGRETRRQKKMKEESEKALKRSCAPRPPARHTHAREETPATPEPRALERVIIAPASDPYMRHQALVDLAQDIARELPPPSLPDHKIGRQYTGLATGEKRAEWIDYIDQVARRWPGPLNAHDISKITGAPVMWAQRCLAEWRALLERGITEEQRRSMALSLGAEAEAIAREALALVQSSGDERLKAAGLKLALDSLARRQSLIGADKISLEARVEVTQGSWTEHAAAAGLTGDELRQIGDIASKAISRQAREED
jgi:hypothetical protein